MAVRTQPARRASLQADPVLQVWLGLRFGDHLRMCLCMYMCMFIRGATHWGSVDTRWGVSDLVKVLRGRCMHRVLLRAILSVCNVRVCVVRFVCAYLCLFLCGQSLGRGVAWVMLTRLGLGSTMATAALTETRRCLSGEARGRAVSTPAIPPQFMGEVV